MCVPSRPPSSRVGTETAHEEMSSSTEGQGHPRFSSLSSTSWDRGEDTECLRNGFVLREQAEDRRSSTRADSLGGWRGLLPGLGGRPGSLCLALLTHP